MTALLFIIAGIGLGFIAWWIFDAIGRHLIALIEARVAEGMVEVVEGIDVLSGNLLELRNAFESHDHLLEDDLFDDFAAEQEAEAEAAMSPKVLIFNRAPDA